MDVSMHTHVPSSAGASVGPGQDLVPDLGVGDGPMLLAQVQAQLALVAEVQLARLALGVARGRVSTCSRPPQSWGKSPGVLQTLT